LSSSSNVVRLLVLNKTSVWSVCVSKILTDILFYVRDIPQSTRTIREPNLIKWCQWEHLLDRILKGLRVRGAGLKLFMVSINDLVCQLCIGCSLSLSNNGTKLCVITDIFGPSYSFWLLPTYSGLHDKNGYRSPGTKKTYVECTKYVRRNTPDTASSRQPQTTNKRTTAVASGFCGFWYYDI
jgi:hypothetical protein